MVGGDNAPAGGGRGEQPAPQVRPCGVTVRAEEGADRGLYAVVQDMPGARNALRVRGGDRVRPGRVETGQVDPGRQYGFHQAISITLALSPDPMPMSRTRSPGAREAIWPASVNGTETGPMLPYSGKERGTRSGSRPSRAQIASVWTCETWCRTYRSMPEVQPKSVAASAQRSPESCRPASRSPLRSVFITTLSPVHSW